MDVVDKIKSQGNKLDALFIAMGLFGALRVGEITSIRISDVSDDKIQVRKTKVSGKAEKFRYVEKPPLLKEIIESCKLRKSDNLLFPSLTTKRRMTNVGANKRLRKLMELPGITFHALRKTAARRVYETSDKDIPVTAAFLGHANLTSVIYYLGLTQEKVDEATRNAFAL